MVKQNQIILTHNLHGIPQNFLSKQKARESYGKNKTLYIVYIHHKSDNVVKLFLILQNWPKKDEIYVLLSIFLDSFKIVWPVQWSFKKIILWLFDRQSHDISWRTSKKRSTKRIQTNIPVWINKSFWGNVKYRFNKKFTIYI